MRVNKEKVLNICLNRSSSHQLHGGYDHHKNLQQCRQRQTGDGMGDPQDQWRGAGFKQKHRWNPAQYQEVFRRSHQQREEIHGRHFTQGEEEFRWDPTPEAQQQLFRVLTTRLEKPPARGAWFLFRIKYTLLSVGVVLQGSYDGRLVLLKIPIYLYIPIKDEGNGRFGPLFIDSLVVQQILMKCCRRNTVVFWNCLCFFNALIAIERC